MSYANILFDISAGIARLTFNRPDRLNAFNAEMATGLRQAMEHAATDHSKQAWMPH